MAIIEKQQRRMVIDLDGPDGNAYALLGYAKSLGKQLGFDPKTIGMIQMQMTSGDYENLIQVFDKYFGGYVDLERSP